MKKVIEGYVGSGYDGDICLLDKRLIDDADKIVNCVSLSADLKLLIDKRVRITIEEVTE